MMTLWTVLLFFTVFLNLWTMLNSLSLYPLEKRQGDASRHSVSLLVPLRNEAANVKGLTESLKRLTYDNLEVILLDDHSDDDTYDLLVSCTGNDTRFRIIQGNDLPEGWNGKVHACHQLSEQASGDYLLFLDADARVAPDVIERTMATMEKHGAAMVSGFPRYPNFHFLSHMLVPLQHMIVLLHLPLFVANRTTKPMFTAACGIFLMVEKQAYQAIGGHQSVKGSLVEDVHIAREIKKHGYRMILVNITGSVLSYMYDSSAETWAGFKKNIFTGIGRSTVMAVGLSVFYTAVFLLPAFLAVTVLFGAPVYYLLPYLLTVAFKMYTDVKTGHPLWLSFCLPVAIVLLIAILFASMAVHKRGESYQWKGRSYL
ncbi:glycosyltransferase family 2 protein [Halobacillus sp. BAB-2008]|uniref:glycosyltransferase n=1 Tax=Halobacillus sp. BAB-2008 TaxID=1246484 RepID=UPI0002A4E99E|nr:glycosyltransferase family 2 protein [Halobacillus sp. BAB-2008]ELK44588.1 hydroxy-3,4-dehydro-apo-8'-lycopene glucosyltransferase [Halobacillus sp. BAB-2008]